ncbi:MAG: ABC transporter substrate-binding protein [Candidatus Omnitrophica bacterium]|nr:ABC transporter substrate-binding protein [Candidatus Omnitrophota bacterium]
MKRIILLVLFLMAAQECRADEHRIISLAPNATEILFELGLAGAVVGVDEYSNYPQGAKDIERVGTFDKPNIERIILLRPDYILVNTDMEGDKADYLKGLGARIIKVSPKTVEGLCNSITGLGAMFNREARAGLIVKKIRGAVRKASLNTGRPRPKVFVQLHNDPLVTVSSFIGDVIRISGGDNIAWDVKDEAALFSYEVMLQRNPDIMIIIGFSKEWDLPDSISAVRKGRIFKDLDPDIFLRPGPRVTEAIEQLNRIFYEES